MQQWKVFFVKPRTEKKVAQFCRLYGISHYLPLRHSQRSGRQRGVTITLPVFPGYVFAKIDNEQRLQMLKTNLLVRILTPVNSRKMLRDLVMVRKALRVDPGLKPAEPLTHGTRVRIVRGSFAGVEGVVQRMSGKIKVVLSVEMIGQAVGVTVAAAEVEKI